VDRDEGGMSYSYSIYSITISSNLRMTVRSQCSRLNAAGLGRTCLAMASTRALQRSSSFDVNTHTCHCSSYTVQPALNYAADPPDDPTITCCGRHRTFPRPHGSHYRYLYHIIMMSVW
jgi:hypothetical protein